MQVKGLSTFILHSTTTIYFYHACEKEISGIDKYAVGVVMIFKG